MTTPLPMSLAGLAGAAAGRRLRVGADKPLTIQTRTARQDAGQVSIAWNGAAYRLDNRSRMVCLVNGKEMRSAELADGDQVAIGKDVFRVELASALTPVKAAPISAPVVASAPEPFIALRADPAPAAGPDRDDSHDITDTQLVVHAPPKPAVCAVCDGRLGDPERDRGRGWSDGARHICGRCLAKGVKPSHLPRGPGEPAPAPGVASTDHSVLANESTVGVLVDAARATDTAETKAPDLGVPEVAADAAADPAPDSSAAAPDHAAPVEPPTAPREGEGTRHSRRISASRLAAVEPAPARSGLLRKVGKVFGRRDERELRLKALERTRIELLVEAGRLALRSGGGLGLPETALSTLMRGGQVTIHADDLNHAERERWRTQRQRLSRLDAEIAAVRLALGLGIDPHSSAMPAPALRPDEKAHEERTFATLDGMGTDDLGGHAQAAAEEATADEAAAKPGRSSASSARHRPHRRR
jgi:hypothetical protein